MHILLLGAGYSLMRLAQRLPPRSFVVTTTSPDKLAEFDRKGWRAELLDVSDAAQLDALLLRYPGISQVIDSIPPLAAGDPLAGVKNLVHFLAGRGIKRLLYLSTTGVFGVRDGSWVDEMTPLCESDQGSGLRIESERRYAELRPSGIQVTAVRLSGIYGPGRGIGTSLKQGRYRLVDAKRWSNRIHVEDIAAALLECLGYQGELPSTLCLSDDQPAPLQDVLDFYCKEFGLTLPAPVALETIPEGTRRFYTSNQRVSNRLLKQTLGYSFKYPSYHEGAATEFEGPA